MVASDTLFFDALSRSVHANDKLQVLMALGFILAGFLCNPFLVQRSDGSRVILMKNPTWKSELKGLVEVLRTDFYIVALFPMFFASNWFYTYHFQDVNRKFLQRP